MSNQTFTRMGDYLLNAVPDIRMFGTDTTNRR